MHSSSHSMPAQACYYARPGDLLLFRWLPDARMTPHLGGALDSFAPVPGFAAGVRSAPGDTRALILVWCPCYVAQAAKAAIDGAIGPGELTPWAGHLHLEGGWTPLVGQPHITLVGLANQAPPDWLLALLVPTRQEGARDAQH